jgi:uncharacterized coiled-coil DUF342 family protein
MTDKQDIKKLGEEIRSQKKLVSDISKSKEEWFKKKEDLKVDIRDKIQSIRTEKSAKDSKTKEIQTLKKERDIYNSKVKTLITDIKKLNQEKDKFSGKSTPGMSPSRLEKMIDDLEKQVEIETSFKKEQELMEKIKKLKKEYGETSATSKVFDQARTVSKDLQEAKKKAQDFHNQIQEIAKGANYQELIESSKAIMTIKKTQEDAFAQFIDYKNKYLTESKKLKAMLKEQSAHRGEAQKERDTRRAKVDEKNQEIIRAKAAEVDEKIKKGQKLTTDDLLALQAVKD